MRKPLPIIASLVALGAFPAAHADNIGFLRDAPIAFFSKDDIALLEQTVQRSLESNADGETSRWNGDARGSGGEVTPLDTRSVDGTTCRYARIVNRAKQREGISVFEFCRQPDGEWKVVSRAAQ